MKKTRTIILAMNAEIVFRISPFSFYRYKQRPNFILYDGELSDVKKKIGYVEPLPENVVWLTNGPYVDSMESKEEIPQHLKDNVERLAIRELVSNENKIIISEPKETDCYSSKQLIRQGVFGIYKKI
ncbi:MAG: hypothetical protein V3U72_04865 [Candidatus Aenigmarchaeota archaeon]